MECNQGRAKDKSELNHKLDELDEKARIAYKRYIDRDGYIRLKLLKMSYWSTNAKTPYNSIDEMNNEYAKRVGIDGVLKSYTRRLTVRKHLCNFMSYKYGIEDIALRSLDIKFINDFQFYLSVVLQIKTISYNDYLIILRSVARKAVSQKIIKRDPFAGHRMEKPPILHRHLNAEQIQKMMEINLPSYRLCHTRDLFIFSVFTDLGRMKF